MSYNNFYITLITASVQLRLRAHLILNSANVAALNAIHCSLRGLKT